MQVSVIRLLALLVASCASEPPNTTLANASAAGSAAVVAAEPAGTFTQVYEMLFPRTTNAHCDMCHGLPPYDLSNGNLTTGMDKTSTYQALVGKSSTSSKCAGKVMVVPHEPDMSLLYLKLLPNPPCGLRMPNGGANLTDTQLTLVRSWIAAGAADD